MESLGTLRLACLVVALYLVVAMNLDIPVGQVAASLKESYGKNCTKKGHCKFATCCCQLRGAGIPKCYKEGKWFCTDDWISPGYYTEPFCASDGKTYLTETQFAIASCKKDEFLTYRHAGACGKSQAKDLDDMDSELESY